MHIVSKFYKLSYQKHVIFSKAYFKKMKFHRERDWII